MAKKKSDGKKADEAKGGKKSRAEEIAREAGKAAAKAEAAAREALDRAQKATAVLVDLLTHPGQIVGQIGGAFSAGQEKVTHLLTSGTDEAREQVRSAVEDRFKATVRDLGLPTLSEFEALKKRVAELEAAKPGRRVRKTAAKTAAKPAAKPAASKSAAAKRAPVKRAPATAKAGAKASRGRRPATA